MSTEVVNHSHVSNQLPLQKSVRQGGLLSSLLYIMYTNGLFMKLESSGPWAKLLLLQRGNPTLADDITCISLTPTDLQKKYSLQLFKTTHVP